MPARRKAIAVTGPPMPQPITIAVRTLAISFLSAPNGRAKSDLGFLSITAPDSPDNQVRLDGLPITARAQHAIPMTAELDSFRFLTRQIMEQGFIAALRIAALFRVADHIADGPRPVSDLAKLTDTNEDFLRRCLELLATRGVFEKTADDSFALTPSAAALRSDARPCARHSILSFTSEPFVRAIANLDVTAR